MITLWHGDCLELMKSIPDKSIDMVLTDPPYGTTACKWDNIIPFDLMWEQLNRIIKPNGAIILFGAEPFSSYLRISNIKNYKYDWVWQKNPVGFLNAKRRPLNSTENISVFYFKESLYNPQGLVRIDKVIKNSKSNETTPKKRRETSSRISTYNGGALSGEFTQEFTNYPQKIINFNKDSNSLHPTQKPVALLEYLIKTYTKENETVLDFTMGSGSTGIACQNLNSAFVGIEKDDKYFEIAKNRIYPHPQDQ